MLRYLISALTAAAVCGCSNLDISQYKNQEPHLDLQAYLNGNISGVGIVQDRNHNVTKRFKFNGRGYWNGDNGTFDEIIAYSDGKVESRTWSFKKISESSFEATTPDVIGKASIKLSGNSMNWQYTMNIKVDNSTYAINFDDWMFLMDGGKIINRNYFTKFGLNVGELTLFMQKESPDTPKK